MNQHFIVGRLAQQPELKTGASGKNYCSFTVACQTGFPDKETGKKATSFFNCIIFGKQAETLCTYGFSGNQIAVRGEGQIDQYDDKEGKKQRAYKLVVSDFELLEKGGKSEKPATKQAEPEIPQMSEIRDPFSED